MATEALTVVLGMGVGVIIIGPLAKLADPTPNALATKAAVNRRFFILNVYTSELCLKGPSTDYFCSSNLFVITSTSIVERIEWVLPAFSGKASLGFCLC